MKTVKLLLLGCAIAFNPISFSQMDGKHFIKNYKSPEFKLQGLQFIGSGQALGGVDKSPGYEEYHTGFLNGRFRYFSQANSLKYQGNQAVTAGLEFRYNKSESTGNMNGRGSISYFAENRFYLKELFYVGFHSNSYLIPGIHKNKDSTASNFSFFSGTNPAISIGLGRIEFADFARQAMDIDRMLFKSGQVNSRMNEEQLKILSDQIGVLRNTRAFDGRLLRIMQLEQIDSLVGTFGIVDSKDISYFAALNDAYYFSNFTNRRSGFRAELGVTERFNYNQTVFSGIRWANSNIAFIKLDYFLPQSYMIQHDLTFQMYGGYQKRKSESNTTDDYPIWANLSYDFGFYPTTRTSLSLGVDANYSISSTNAFGVSGLVNLRYNYYLSPATRLKVNAQYTLFQSYDYDNRLAGLNPISTNGPLIDQKYAIYVSFVHAIF